MIFRPLEIDDRLLLESVFRQTEYKEQEYSFPFHFLWRDFYKTTIYSADNVVVLRFSFEGENYVYFPVCAEADLYKCIEIMRCDANGRYPIVLAYVSERLAHFCEKSCDVRCLNTDFDYVYSVGDFANPQGGSNKHKREWIHHFEREYPNYRLEPITDERVADCMKVLQQWQLTKQGDDKLVYEPELPIISEALAHREKLGLEGYILMVDEQPVAFMLNYGVTSQWLHCLIAKADIRFHGAARMLEHLVYGMYAEKGYEYVNFGDDNNSESLRNTKERLHPVGKLYKYYVRIKCVKCIHETVKCITAEADL
ncbi:MAG: phosphatidylglycerol lysyltransferase domain-containing protein [Marinifilaceae bacterium]